MIGIEKVEPGIDRAEVIERLEEACDVWRRTPDKERHYLSAGKRVCWPTVIMSYYEAYGQNAVKVRRPPPSPAQIDRADEVMTWLMWLGKEHGRDALRCTWLCLGEQTEVSTVSRVTGLDRKTVRKRRDFGLACLVLHVAEMKKPA